MLARKPFVTFLAPITSYRLDTSFYRPQMTRIERIYTDKFVVFKKMY